MSSRYHSGNAENKAGASGTGNDCIITLPPGHKSSNKYSATEE